MENIKNKDSRPEELRFLEVEGSTPVEAINKAIAILGVTRKEVKVKILSEEDRGLFGMAGVHPAKVRVSLIKPEKGLTS